jgi:FKBP-type peptidyl-prolyl cis-trans isomerase
MTAQYLQEEVKEEKKEQKKEEKVGYTKEIIRKGDGVNFPKKGDTVSCRYRGMCLGSFH